MNDVIPPAPASAEASSSTGLRTRLAAFQDDLANRTWRAFMVIAIVGGINNVLAIIAGGIKASFVVNITIATLVTIANIFIKKIPVKIKVPIMLGLLLMVGLGNFPNGGMFGAGWYWFVGVSLLIAVFYSIRGGIIALTLFGILLTIIGYSYANGFMKSTFDLNIRNAAPDSWVNFFTTVIILSAVLLYAIGGYLKAIRDLLADVQTQREKAEFEREQAEVARAETARALDDLSKSQAKLVQAEKLAALGSLVAGVAHELNTPIGNALMISTTLAQNIEELNTTMKSGLKKSALENFIEHTASGNEILRRNLSRSAELISSFKQIAVDQTNSQRRTFDLREVCTDVVVSMTDKLRMTPYALINDIPEGVTMDSFPGPLGQIMMSSISNALTHAFEGRDMGCMKFSVEDLSEESLTLVFRDDGTGIPDDVVPRVFEPFFTTKLGQGGSGLGLHIVHNIATGLLGGSVQVHSSIGAGTEFRFIMPRIAPVK